nr:MAG TPA: hypothetical protein [Caudoviricetes sp.]
MASVSLTFVYKLFDIKLWLRCKMFSNRLKFVNN